MSAILASIGTIAAARTASNLCCAILTEKSPGNVPIAAIRHE
jgi:hypothetical protein